MIRRAILSREFLITAVIIVAAMSYWGYMLYQDRVTQKLLVSPLEQISLTEDNLSQIPNSRGHIVAVSDFEFFGEPFEEDGWHGQLLAPKGVEKTNDPNAMTLVLARSNKLCEQGLREMITGSRGGCWFTAIDAEVEEMEPISEDAGADTDVENVEPTSEDAQNDFVHPDYPDLKLDSLSSIHYADPKSQPWNWCIPAVHVLALLAALWFQVKTMKKREEWEAKLENFNPEVLNQYPHAQRLCGVETLGLPIRRVDPEFDVVCKPVVKNPKLKRWGWKIGSVIAIAVVGGMLQYGTSDQLEQFLNGGEWARLAVTIFFMLAVNFAIFKAQQAKVGGVQEERIKPGSRWAKYQKLPFFKYHDHVLKELGMVELGSFRHVGLQHAMVRTIYLSPDGNVLVEVGIEGHREYFTIETVVNSGKFLETHSMAKPSMEKRDLLHRHQRRSASHEDILKALEDHDHFVSEFAGRGFLEAQYNEDRMPRFIEWGGEKNAV